MSYGGLCDQLIPALPASLPIPLWSTCRALLRLAAAHPPLHGRHLPPAGIIGTNLVDAEQTVDTMVQTQDSFRAVQAAAPGGEGLRALLAQRGVQVRRRALCARGLAHLAGAAGWLVGAHGWSQLSHQQTQPLQHTISHP